MTEPPIDEYFFNLSVTPEQMDLLLSNGWRHFGIFYFRYQFCNHNGKDHTVIPLRIDLTNFSESRSQKRILAKNRDVNVVIKDTFIDEDKERLFYHHSKRFKENVPTSIYNFLSERPSSIPCHNQEISAYLGKNLIATSFLDIGTISTSAVYAMFDPSESRRSLGIFTMLIAIRYSIARGCRYYYPGYAYKESSIYDYKKNFSGLEYFNWINDWYQFKPTLVGNEDHEKQKEY
jgi:leucyl-tRNA---protein transferase